MIKFFRKIRKNLISEGKTRKYFKYAIGEIVLVVIGILIALQINNWNENRIRDKSVKNHLINLTKAIEHDIRELTISMEFNEFRYHSWQYLLQMSGVPIDTLPDMPRPDSYIAVRWDKSYPVEINNDFIIVSMQEINEAFLNMAFNYSAINEMNNLGILSDLNNDSLKLKINEYYYHLDWKFGEQTVNSRHKLAEDLKNYLRDKHAISCNYISDPQGVFKVIREDERVVIMFKDLIKKANSHYWVTQNLRELGIKLIEKINKELN